MLLDHLRTGRRLLRGWLTLMLVPAPGLPPLTLSGCMAVVEVWWSCRTSALTALSQAVAERAVSGLVKNVGGR